jgi:zinc transport system substrate-binding protein
MLLAAWLFAYTTAAWSTDAVRTRIGVTLHPYYSFAAGIVGDSAEVVPLIGAGFNPHAYEPQPEDIKRAMTLDALIVNGVGHDEFAFEIVDAAQVRDKLPLIYANEGVALIPVAGGAGSEKVVNSHTFISITTSIQQVYTITGRLAALFPQHAAVFRANSREYVARQRKLKAGYMDRVAGLGSLDFRCATIHGAYDYLLQEFGLRVSAVIEPRHGVQPTASQLRDTIERIKAVNADVVFSELHFTDEYVEVIRQATGIRVHSFSHISGGEFTAAKFEEEMGANLEALTTALREAAERRGTAQEPGDV